MENTDPQTPTPKSRLSIDLDVDLHRKAKVKAAREELTLSELVRGWLEQWVEGEE
jgi:predicted HicB family RNase H-like nuclease